MQSKGAGETIQYATATTPLGLILVARTERGLCAVSFGDTEQHLTQELRDRFPAATLQMLPEDHFAAEIDDLRTRLQQPAETRSLPAMDLAGTPFERRVWAAMAEIPAGQICEYGQFASGLGLAKAPRAVGAAIGKNPIALLLPCHRLVAKGGSLHRYRWGIERKRWLLEREGVALPTLEAAQGELPLDDLE